MQYRGGEDLSTGDFYQINLKFVIDKIEMMQSTFLVSSYQVELKISSIKAKGLSDFTKILSQYSVRGLRIIPFSIWRFQNDFLNSVKILRILPRELVCGNPMVSSFSGDLWKIIINMIIFKVLIVIVRLKSNVYPIECILWYWYYSNIMNKKSKKGNLTHSKEL